VTNQLMTEQPAMSVKQSPSLQAQASSANEENSRI